MTALRRQLEVGNCQMQQVMLHELAELDRNHEADLQVAMSTLQSSFEEKARRVASSHACTVARLGNEAAEAEAARAAVQRRLEEAEAATAAERKHRETMFSRERERLEAQIAVLKRTADGAKGDIMKTVVAPLEAELMDALARHRMVQAKLNELSEGDATGKRRWLWVLALVAFELLRELRRVTLHGFAARTTAACDSSWAATVIMAATLTVWLSTAACAGRTVAAVLA